ncbi:protein-L-isoaspartate(D-aspartate) O-methyltransferase-like [Anopheles coustani]|uniref:protein-L-isoaspartate(D-aspartate) O-methyltransferase-like n=1 Tax=Anopheles coustani TaxID=139045 RepID=UPI00265AABD1|nr:protein-L-isoaspartate(D-aspartate) O-methyltransferase-like [Anopheles coustani]
MLTNGTRFFSGTTEKLKCANHRILQLYGNMAWRSQGVNNADLIRQLQENRFIRSKLVAQAMKKTDRKYYVPERSKAYLDSPQLIGYGATISAPHMHAYAMELLRLNLTPNSKVLDVGSGSGYLTACMARYIHQKPAATGFVVGIEHHPRLVELGRKNIGKDDQSLIETGKVILVEGDGRQGYQQHAPYDCIHVGAAAPETPQELINQLKPGGRLIVPVCVDDGKQQLMQYDKGSDGTIFQTKLMDVNYIPLTDLQH